MSITVSLINYDVAQLIESSLPRSNDNSNWFGPAGVSLPHDICRSRSVDPNLHISTHTQIPQNLNRSALPGSTVPTTLRRSSLTDLQKCITWYSHHLHSPSAQLSFQVKDKPGQRLTGVCVHYYKSRSQTALQRSVLNQHRQRHYIKTPFSMQVSCGPTTRPVSYLNNSWSTSYFRFIKVLG
jgi:hypothetical protein